MRAFLSEENRQLFEARAQSSSVSEERREGCFRLFNKNNFSTLHVPILGQSLTTYGWFVEAPQVPAYFTNVLLPA